MDAVRKEKKCSAQAQAQAQTVAELLSGSKVKVDEARPERLVQERSEWSLARKDSSDGFWGKLQRGRAGKSNKNRTQEIEREWCSRRRESAVRHAGYIDVAKATVKQERARDR